MVQIITGSYIAFVLCGDTGKTLVYDVNTSDGEEWLGTVKWFGRWRKYSFFAAPNTVFESTCLREISDFCDRLMKERKDARSNAKKAVPA